MAIMANDIEQVLIFRQKGAETERHILSPVLPNVVVNASGSRTAVN